MAQVAGVLAEMYPDATVELDHQNPYQLIVATILSAQSTDKLINTVTPALFERFPDATALAGADQGELEKMVFSTGFFRMKAKHLIEMARAVVTNHGGEIPDTMDALVQLPGVARKTANVVLGCSMGKNEGVIVDTHVTRVAQRLGLTSNTDPVKIEQDLMKLVPQNDWTKLGNRLIWLGRRVCTASNPNHEQCLLAPLCPSATLVPLATAAKAKGKAKSATKPAKSSSKAPAAKSSKAKAGAKSKRKKK